LGLYLRLPELFLDDEEEDERELPDRFFELVERLREEADRDDLDFLVAGIFVFPPVSKWQHFPALLVTHLFA
jgi:hypothetical protein